MRLLSLAAVCVGTHASEVPVSYPSTDSNVRYKQVTELGFKHATEKLVYGEEDPGLQYSRNDLRFASCTRRHCGPKQFTAKNSKNAEKEV